MRHQVKQHTTTNINTQGSRGADLDKFVAAYKSFLNHSGGAKFPILLSNPTYYQLNYTGPVIYTTIDKDSKRTCSTSAVPTFNEPIKDLGLSVTESDDNHYTEFNIPGEHNNPMNSLTIVRTRADNSDYCLCYVELLNYDVSVVLTKGGKESNLNAKYANATFVKSTDIGVSLYPCNALNTYPDGITTFVVRIQNRTYTVPLSKPANGTILYAYNCVQLPVNFIQDDVSP